MDHASGIGSGILCPGEKLHIIERRQFEGDVRRHFVGEVEEVSGSHLRVRGHAFVYSDRKQEFTRRAEERIRVFTLDSSLVINLLPPTIAVAEIRYVHSGTGLKATDGRSFQLDINEFMPTSGELES